jgi:hypothetical protein
MQARDGDSEDFSSDASPSSSEEYVVVSSDGEIDRDARKQKWKKIEKDRENMTLRECLSHECDYSIVGSTTWMLLTQKFDYDVEIQRDAIALDEDGEKPAEYGVVIYPNGGGLTGGSAIDTGEDSDFSFVHFTKDYKFDYGNSYAVSQGHYVRPRLALGTSIFTIIPVHLISIQQQKRITCQLKSSSLKIPLQLQCLMTQTTPVAPT